MRLARRLFHACLIVLTLVIGATAAAVIVTQTAWFKNWLRAYIVREAHQYLNGQMSIQRLGGNLFFGLELENIGVSMDGSQVVAVKDLGLDYNVFELISRGLSVDNIRLNKPVLYLRREGDTWSISRLIKKEAFEADREGPGRPVTLQDIGISDGSVMIEGPVGTTGVEIPKRFEHLDAKLNFKYEPVHYSIEITHVSFRGSEPAIGLNALSGGVSVRNDTVFLDKLALRTEETSLSIVGAVQHYLSKPLLNLQITADKVSLPEIARLVPALAGVRLQPAFELKLGGPMDQLGVDMNVRSSAGQVMGALVADLLQPRQSVTGKLSVRHLDLAPILQNPRQKSDITAAAEVDLQGAKLTNVGALHGTVKLNAAKIMAAGFTAEQVKANARVDGRRVALDGRAAAYGATATAAGRVTLPEGSEPIAYDLRGQARHVDLRKLPRRLKIPAAATNISADSYHIVGTGSSFSADARLSPSTVSGARIAAGSTAGVSVRGGDVAYRADATVADLDVQRIGQEFNIRALASDRYKSSINGHITTAGHGTRPREMDLTAHGTLTDTSILGGRLPRLAFDATVAGDTVHVKANGSFADFDPAVATGKPAFKGSVGGNLDVDATVAGVSRGLTPDTVEATGTFNLEPSTIGDVAIDRATIDADYYNSTGVIRSLDVKGRDFNAQATGTLALKETGQSNLTFHADTPSLTEIGQLVNQPLAGMAKVDGTITGNKRELTASGHFIGNGVKYGEHGALTMSADYTVKVPGLTFADAKVAATTHATFVTVAGQNINEVTAKTDYDHQQLTFDATGKQPQRTVATAGSLLVHPDHREVHLQKLTLDTQGQQWQLASGPAAAIQYRKQTLAVHDLRLVSGDQRIAVNGTFGRPGDALAVTLANVDLASVDALLLRPPQFSGRVNATSTVTGTTAAPEVKAEFHIARGGFRQFHYDSLDGTVNYAKKGLTLDARLQQSPAAWLTAKGYVPLAMFKRATPDGGTRTHLEALTADDRIDLHIESSPIDLGLVQGFTTELTNVTGTVQANIDVTGAVDDPHPLGAITIQNGAFTVESTGVAYTNLDGRIDLQTDRVHVDQIQVLDNHRKPLSIAGDLAIHELRVGTFNVALKADDFKVIDNEMGDVRVNSDLRITGELRQPRVEGDLGVSTGVINLDPILADFGDSAYATTPREYVTGPADPSGQGTPLSPFGALRMNVHLTVPNDLVVKSSDLRTPNAPIGLGAMTVTLGGDVTATKDPGGKVRLLGVINTVRGTYTFQGRRFDILREGTVRFHGLEGFDPTLDIRTRRVIQAVEARVDVRGTLSQPEIVLSSTPPLEEADILSLIVFNQPVNQLGEGQQISLAQRAGQLATGAIAGTLAESIGSALKVNTFEINTGFENGGLAQLTVGQQIGQDLYVKVQQEVGDQSQTNFVLEYELTNWLRLQTNVLQGSSTQQQLFQRMQGSGIDLLFFFSY